MDAFGPALSGADEIVLTDIYAASEEPIAGVTLERLAESIRRGSGRPVHLAPTLNDVVETILRVTRPGDAVMTLGAGSIGTMPPRLLKALEPRGARS
jgi:UDP-N-acetylmuramate--alanine ligase